MDTKPITSATLASSVIAVPPLARTETLHWDHAQSQRLIQHLEAGGIRTLLYGGNAVLGHVALSDYAELLTMLTESVSAETLVIPSVGPGFGMMRDQARILREYDFPTAMVLPTKDPTTPAGIAAALSRFVDSYGRPAVLYLKHDGTIEIDAIQRLLRDGVISWIKYAIVRDNPSEDPYLRELIGAIGPALIVSGMGEQPALTHIRDFGLPGFTSGCVCSAPQLSTALLRANQVKDYARAEAIRIQFRPLEMLRDSISPVRVLHEAVQLAGIADTGPITPPLSPIDGSDRIEVERAVERLLADQTSTLIHAVRSDPC